MTIRLQVAMDEAGLADYRRLAESEGMTLAEWVQQKLRRASREEPTADVARKLAAVRAGADNVFPAPGVDQILAEIESGYRS